MTQTKFITRPYGNRFNGVFNSLLADMERSFGQAVQQPYTAPVNIAETADAFHLELLAPGRSKEAFTLNIEDGHLVIAYKAPEETANSIQFARKEFTLPSFSRSFFLDDKVNTDGIQAKYEQGILKVLLPKKAEAQAVQKQISIQ